MDRLQRPGAFQTCLCIRATEARPPAQVGGAEKASWILKASVHKGAHPVTSKKMTLLSASDLYNLLLFLEVREEGGKFYQYWLVGKYIMDTGEEKGSGTRQEPESPTWLKNFQSVALCACGNIASICGHVNTANTTATLLAQFGKAEAWGSAGSEEGTEESGDTDCEQRKRQWCYLRVRGRAGVLSCSLRDGSLLPLGDTLSDLIPSRTWTWAYCPGQTDVALRKSGWKGLCTQNQFAPDIYWLWPVS